MIILRMVRIYTMISDHSEDGENIHNDHSEDGMNLHNHQLSLCLLAIVTV